jgi:hypothetical protein
MYLIWIKVIAEEKGGKKMDLYISGNCHYKPKINFEKLKCIISSRATTEKITPITEILGDWCQQDGSRGLPSPCASTET